MPTGSLSSTCSASSINTGGALHNTGIGTGGNHSIGPQQSTQGSQVQSHSQQASTIRHKVLYLSKIVFFFSTLFNSLIIFIFNIIIF